MTQPPGPPYPGQPYQGYPAQQAPYGGYPAYGAYPPPPPRDTNIWAILALVSALTIPPLAIVAGHVALSQLKRTGDQGRGLAIAGLVLGYLLTAIAVVAMIAVVWIESSAPDYSPDYNRDYSYSMSVTSGLTAPQDRGPLPLSGV